MIDASSNQSATGGKAETGQGAWRQGSGRTRTQGNNLAGETCHSEEATGACAQTVSVAEPELTASFKVPFSGNSNICHGLRCNFFP